MEIHAKRGGVVEMQLRGAQWHMPQAGSLIQGSRDRLLVEVLHNASDWLSSSQGVLCRTRGLASASLMEEAAGPAGGAATAHRTVASCRQEHPLVKETFFFMGKGDGETPVD